LVPLPGKKIDTGFRMPAGIGINIESRHQNANAGATNNLPGYPAVFSHDPSQKIAPAI